MPTKKDEHLQLIRTHADLQQGVSALRRKCSHIRTMHDVVGNPSMRKGKRGFPGLARIIVGQQVSAASAKAIWKRVEAGIQPMTAESLLKLNDAKMAGLGLSRPKIRSLRALADACADGTLNLKKERTLSDDELREKLMCVKGIGPWTADIYLLFCLARRDAFASGDLALQVAAQNLFDLPERPSSEELQGLSERWQPWRGVAARLMWAYYEKQLRTGAGQPL